MGGETLHRGQKAAGVGQLAAEIPERWDGDKDTVAAERRPRKGDAYPISPESVPQQLRERVIAGLNRDQLRVLTLALYSREEKKRVKDLFDKEREAVRAGETASRSSPSAKGSPLKRASGARESRAMH